MAEMACRPGRPVQTPAAHENTRSEEGPPFAGAVILRSTPSELRSITHQAIQWADAFFIFLDTADADSTSGGAHDSA